VTCPRIAKDARTRSRGRDPIQPCHSCGATGSFSKASTPKMYCCTLSPLGAKVIGFTVHAFASQGRQFFPPGPYVLPIATIWHSAATSRPCLQQ
jgi:hypothetical protein